MTVIGDVASLRITRRLGAACVLASVVLAAAACGGSSGPSSGGGGAGGGAGGGVGGGAGRGTGGAPTGTQSPLQAVQLVSAHTAAAKSAHIHFTMSMSIGGLPAGLPGGAGAGGTMSITMDGSGQTDFANHDSELALAFGGSLGSMLGGTTGGTSLQMIQIGSTIYMGGAIVQSEAAGNKWVSMNLSELSGMNALGGAFSDPSEFLQFLETVGSVTPIGSKVIAGVPVTGYKAVVDLQKLTTAEHLPPNIASLLACLPHVSFPMTVWIDSSGRAREITVSWDLAKMLSGVMGALGGTGSSSGLSALMTMQVDFSGFGDPVHITAPPAADVTPITLPGSLGSTTVAHAAGAFGTCPSISA